MYTFEHIADTVVFNETGLVFKETGKAINVTGEGPFNLVVDASEPVSLQVVIDQQKASEFTLNYIIAANASVKLVEVRHLHAQSQYQRHVQIEEGAHVEMILVNESDHQGDLHLVEEVHVAKDATLKVGYGELADGNQESQYTYELDGEGAHVELSLAALSKEGDRKHFTVTLNHHARNTYGNMENYGAVKDQARLIFDGVGRIDRGMHLTSTHQTSKIMVLDDGCIAKANPYLYIDDYDVKASHAAGVGRMDDDHLYYLQSRGLTKSQAMHLITYGYLLPAIANMRDEKIAEHFEAVLEKKVGNA